MKFAWIDLPHKYLQYLEGWQMPASILSDNRNNCNIILFSVIDLDTDTLSYILNILLLT